MDGDTALHLACRIGCAYTVEALLELEPHLRLGQDASGIVGDWAWHAARRTAAGAD